MNSEIYQELVLERYKNPLNAGAVENPDAVSKEYNPSCGDVIEVQIKFDSSRIEDVKFQGEGCAISQSSVDLLIDFAKSKGADELKKFQKEDFLNMLGIELSPNRLKCALLGFKALKTALYTYLGRQTAI